MKVVVDASNVAHHVKNENSQPQMANILAAVKALEESEDEFWLECNLLVELFIGH